MMAAYFSTDIHAAPEKVSTVAAVPGAVVIEFSGSHLVIFTGDADLARDLHAAMQGVIDKHRSPAAKLAQVA
jgi:hypothetical protein